MTSPHVPTPSPSPPLPALEPRFSLSADTPLSSKTSLVIGGIRIYVYGLEELKRPSGVEVAVLHLAHMRTRTYAVTEAMAHEILHQYRSSPQQKRLELIAVTMDMRNHGEREVSRETNLTWKDGNENHAADLLSTISGSAYDFHLVLQYLDSYLSQFTALHNILMGISLGAHMVYRLGPTLPTGLVEGYAIVVGCPNLSSLLLGRLGIEAATLNTTPDRLDLVPYEQLAKVMTSTQRRRWKKPISDLTQQGDDEVFRNFPSNVPVITCNGRVDPLVPTFYTESWLERRRAAGRDLSNTEFYVQGNTGHSCTKEMVGMIATWIGRIYATA